MPLLKVLADIVWTNNCWSEIRYIWGKGSRTMKEVSFMLNFFDNAICVEYSKSLSGMVCLLNLSGTSFCRTHLVTSIVLSGDGTGNPLRYSWLENPMDRWAWWSAVHGVAKSQAWLSHTHSTFSTDFHFFF